MNTAGKTGRILTLTLMAGVILAAVPFFCGGAAAQADERSRNMPRPGEEPAPLSAEPFAQDGIVILKEDGERLNFDVEMAVTPRQLAYGLMNRTEMPENAGMLFVFNNVEKRSFWMKDTLIPLDMLFLHADGRIHHIHHNARPQDLTGITSEAPSKAVLELNGGAADKMGIKEGDRVLHRLFRNLNAE